MRFSQLVTDLAFLPLDLVFLPFLCVYFTPRFEIKVNMFSDHLRTIFLSMYGRPLQDQVDTMKTHVHLVCYCFHVSLVSFSPVRGQWLLLHHINA